MFIGLALAKVHEIRTLFFSDDYMIYTIIPACANLPYPKFIQFDDDVMIVMTRFAVKTVSSIKDVISYWSEIRVILNVLSTVCYLEHVLVMLNTHGED